MRLWWKWGLAWVSTTSAVMLLVASVVVEPETSVAHAQTTADQVTVAGSPCLPTGDVNGDTLLTPADAVAVLEHYIRRQLLSTCDQEQGDVFRPGSGLTPRDAQCLMQTFLALPSCFDRDGDGLPDTLEMALGLDPNNPDTDGDGILDGDEDLDQDGLTNIQEFAIGHNPGLADSDGDGVLDGDEDSDRDGWVDGIEVATMSDPLDPSSQPLLLIVSPAPAKVGVLDPITTVAAPPVSLAILTPGELGALPAGVTVAQPPVSVRIQPSAP